MGNKCARERKGGGSETKRDGALGTDPTFRSLSKTALRFESNYSSKAQVASTLVNKRSKRAGRTVRFQRCVRTRLVIASKTRTGVQSAPRGRERTSIFQSLEFSGILIHRIDSWNF